jgi:hypothetical protein
MALISDLGRISFRVHTEKNHDFFLILNNLFIGYDEEISEVPIERILQVAREHDLDADSLMRQITDRIFYFPFRYSRTVCENLCDKKYLYTCLVVWSSQDIETNP